MRFSSFMALQALFSIVALSQSDLQSTLKLLPQFETKGYSIPTQYLGEEEGKHFMIFAKGRYGHSTSFLAEFDSSFSLKNEYSIFDEDDEIVYSQITQNKLLTVAKQVTRNQHNYYLVEIDLQNPSANTQKNILSSLKYEDRNMVKVFNFFGLSSDESFFYLITESPTEGNSFTLKKYDLSLNFIGEQVYILPNSNEYKNLKLFKVFSNRVILVSDKIVLLDNANTKSIRRHQRHLISLEENNTKTLPLHSIDKTIGTILSIMNDDILNVFSYYSDKSQPWLTHSHGILFSQIDLSNFEQISTQFSPFTQDVLENHSNITRVKKDILESKMLENYVGTHLFHNQDSSFTFIGEQLIVASGAYASALYISKNVMASKISTEGELEWIKEIKNKSNSERTTLYSSSLTIPSEDRKYIFKGHRRSAAKLIESKYALGIQEIIPEESEFIYDEIGDFRFSPTFYVRLDNNKLLLYFQHFKKFEKQKFGILDLSEL